MNMLYAIACGTLVFCGCNTSGLSFLASIFFGVGALAALMSIWLSIQEES